jgi:hypothetical protein
MKRLFCSALPFALVTAAAQFQRDLHHELSLLKMLQHFNDLRRRNWQGLGIQCKKVAYPSVDCKTLPDDVMLRFTSGGRGKFGGRPFRPDRPANRGGLTGERDQIAPQVFKARLLRYTNNSQPIWDGPLWDAYASMQASRETLSPPAYPHAAEDIAHAITSFLELDTLKHMRVGVWSSITPWVESVLMGLGASNVTTVDFNEPLLGSGTPPAMHTLPLQSLARVYAEGRRFDLIVSFSGLEHDGLGSYGDPVHPDGDLAAMAEIRALLSARGTLLLGIPICLEDDIYFPNHRLYGPVRLPMMLSGFHMRGRVWAGRAVQGGFESAGEPPILYRDRRCTFNERMVERFGPTTAHKWPPCNLVFDGLVRNGSRRQTVPMGLQDWQHQPLLILHKAGQHDR